MRLLQIFTLLAFQHSLCLSFFLSSSHDLSCRTRSLSFLSVKAKAGASVDACALLFRCISEDYLLVDPSGGSCCRNACQGCEFVIEEMHSVIFDSSDKTNEL